MRKLIIISSMLCGILSFKYLPQFSAGLTRIKSVTNLKTNVITEYEYDARGSILFIKNSRGSTMAYTYGNNCIVKSTIDRLSNKNSIDTIKLNENGLMLSIGATDPEVYQQLTYDGSRHLVRSKIFGLNSVYQTYILNYVDGNEVNSTYVNAQGKLVDTRYTVYNNKLNTIGQQNMGLLFMQADSKNLPASSFTVSTTNDTTYYLHYNYHFDSKQRVSHRIIYSSTGAVMDSSAYTYY